MDQKLTQRLADWLSLPADQRDTETGRMLVLQLLNNPILAANFQRFPKKFMPHVEYQLRKKLNLRIAGATHEDVTAMRKQVTTISHLRHLTSPLPGTDRMKPVNRVLKTDEFRKGKREDHNQLPEDIQALYTENASVLQQMRAIHERLVIIQDKIDHGSKEFCPDSDIYPLVSEIIELDTKYRDNWNKYDEYQA